MKKVVVQKGYVSRDEHFGTLACRDVGFRK